MATTKNRPKKPKTKEEAERMLAAARGQATREKNKREKDAEEKDRQIADLEERLAATQSGSSDQPSGRIVIDEDDLDGDPPDGPPDEPPTLVFENEPGDSEPEDNEPDHTTRNRVLAIGGVVLIVLILLGLAIAFATSGSDDSDDGTSAPAAQASEPTGSSDQGTGLTVAEAKEKLLNSTFGELSKPKHDYSQDGRFIVSGIHGSNGEKLMTMVKAGAQDQVTLVGMMQQQTNGTYPMDKLAAVMKAGYGSKAHRLVWEDFRTLMTDDGTTVKDITLNGKYMNGGLAENGTVTATLASYSDEPGTGVTTEGMMLGGEYIPAQDAKYKVLCGNRQTKGVPSFAVKSPKPGFIPPNVTPPPNTPNSPPKDIAPINDQPGAHGTGQYPTGDNGDYQGPDPTPADPADPPVVTPPDTGGEIKPGGTGPATDPGGNGPAQPTQPPTQQPDIPPNTNPGGTGPGSQPPPPEEGAPPPP